MTEASRHLTLAFLGKVSKERILSKLQKFPAPSSPLSPAGICDKLLFLPKDNPHIIAYTIYGYTTSQIYLHAQLARAFEYPPFLSHISSDPTHTLEEIVVRLNEKIAKLDQEDGSPFKAVSFHEDLARKNRLFFWEMIVDV